MLTIKYTMLEIVRSKYTHRNRGIVVPDTIYWVDNSIDKRFRVFYAAHTDLYPEYSENPDIIVDK